MQQNSFTNATQIAQQNFKNSLLNTGTGAALNFGSGLISAGLNYAMTSSLLSKQAELQRENFDYTTNKASTAYQQAGLPSWLAYGGSSNSFAHQSQSLGGANSFTSALPGNTSNIVWTGSSSQTALGVGELPPIQ